MRKLGRTVAVVLLSSVSVAGLGSPVLAQSAPAADDDDGSLAEIIVTANKREENLQRAPLAISAVSAEQLDLRGLSEVKDLSAIAPNVSIIGGTTNATSAVVTIRGIATPADETQGFDSPVGLYLDGVYLARSSAATFEIADTERVEVLRGPQGTLFGRNTTGGAINFITKRPDEDASLRVRLGGGNYGQLLGRFILNSGDLGGLRMSIGYLRRQRDGIVDNLLEPKDSKDPGGNRTNGVRWAVEADLSERVKVYNVFDYTRIKGTPAVSQLSEVGDGTFRPNVTFDGATFSQVQPANIAGYLAGATIVEPGCPKLVSPRRQNRICNDLDGPSTDKLWGNMFRVEAEFDAFTVRSTSAYRSWRNKIEGSDLDGLGSLNGPLFNIGATPTSTFTGFPASVLTGVGIPAGTAAFLVSGTVPRITQPLFSATNNRRQHQYSQELEIVSNGDGPFQWVLGGFYFKEKGRERNLQNIGFVLDTNQTVYTTATAQGILTGFMFPLATAQALAPGLAAAFRANNPAQFRIVPNPTVLDYEAGGRSTAIYGQASYRPGGEDGALGVTLGLRYSWDRKNVFRKQNAPVPFTTAADIDFNKRRKSFSAPTGHLTVDYRASDDINLYARAARGYRSGGFNLRQSTHDGARTAPPFGNRTIPLTPFNEETIWSYELGAKTEIGNIARLNFAAFHNIYSDQLATVPVPIVGAGGFGTITINAGKTTYTGFEVEGQVRVGDNFSIDGNLGYLDVKIKRFPAADINNVTQNIAGLLRGQGYAPKFTGSIAANLNVPLSGDTKLTGRLGYSYTSSFKQFPNPLTAPFSVVTDGDSRGLVDGQIRIDGIKFGGEGEGLGITFWGKNLTNEKYNVRSVDFGQLGFATNIFGDPRTYGMTLDVKF